jgi:hypothetical protein
MTDIATTPELAPEAIGADYDGESELDDPIDGEA